MITIGVDFHKKTSTYHVINEDGSVIKRCKFNNDPERIITFVTQFAGPKQLAMEATRSWSLYYDCINEHVDHFMLGHPKRMKALINTERKNDKNDAKHIAELAHHRYWPYAHVTSRTEREVRTIVRLRGFLVNERRSIKNQIHSLIDRNVWPSHRPRSFKNIFCARGRIWLTKLTLSDRERYALDRLLITLDHFDTQINDLEMHLTHSEVDFPLARYLRTVPGFHLSKVNLYTVLVETSDSTRFHKAKGYAYYAGLVPREYSSGEKYRTGRLVKGANMHLRTALIESTLAAIRVDKGLRAYYKSVKQRSGSGAAVIATARKVAYAVYYVLKYQRPYYNERSSHNAPMAACHSSSPHVLQG